MAQTLISSYKELCQVRLPYQGRQHYMHEFDLSAITVPEGFDDYLPVVSALCAAAGARCGTAYLTVDEKIVVAGGTQRRPGPHVDGCFMPAQGKWGGGGWNHYCNNVPFARMPIIVAASEQGCRAWRGEFAFKPDEGGDLTPYAAELGDGELLPANVGYLLSPDCVHESMQFSQPTQRTFVRIALPVDFRAA
jgi:hypothetical protein